MATRGVMAHRVIASMLFLLLSGRSASAEERRATAKMSSDGAGNDNGVCGFGDTVTVPPFSGLVAGFGNEDECGMCYQVRCTGHPACWVSGVRVTVTDSCRSAQCADHFDLAGHAFGALADLGRAAELRAVGNVTVLFDAVDCHYKRPSNLTPRAKFPAIKIDPSATKENFSVTLIYTEGWASWKQMDVQLQNAGERVVRMTHTHGATWKYAGALLQLSRLQCPSKAPATVVYMSNVIPMGWQPGRIYVMLL